MFSISHYFSIVIISFTYISEEYYHIWYQYHGLLFTYINISFSSSFLGYNCLLYNRISWPSLHTELYFGYHSIIECHIYHFIWDIIGFFSFPSFFINFSICSSFHTFGHYSLLFFLRVTYFHIYFLHHISLRDILKTLFIVYYFAMLIFFDADTLSSTTLPKASQKYAAREIREYADAATLAVRCAWICLISTTHYESTAIYVTTYCRHWEMATAPTARCWRWYITPLRFTFQRWHIRDYFLVDCLSSSSYHWFTRLASSSVCTSS